MADIIRIDDSTVVPEPPPGQSMGLVPRDFRVYPPGHYMCARKFDLPLLSDQEIEEAIVRQRDEQSSPKDVFFREGAAALSQNGQGYCWAYSTTSGIMLARMIVGLGYKRLSGHMIGCLVKGYRDQGGWNAQSIEFAAENGVASVDTWAEQSMSRSNDTPAMRADAKLRMVLEFMDLDDSGPNLKRQLATVLASGMVAPSDYNWWSHSVLAGKLTKWGPNGANFAYEILNSWGDWSDRGWGELSGSKAVPNGCIAIRATAQAS